MIVFAITIQMTILHKDPSKVLNGQDNWIINLIFPLVQDWPLTGETVLKSFTTIIFYSVEQTPPETCTEEIEKTEMIKSVM